MASRFGFGGGDLAAGSGGIGSNLAKSSCAVRLLAFAQRIGSEAWRVAIMLRSLTPAAVASGGSIDATGGSAPPAAAAAGCLKP